MKKIISLVVAANILLTSGCATMFNGTGQTVNIRSNDESAKLFVNDQYMGKHSTALEFKKKENYVIRAEKAGCESTTVVAQKEFDPTTLLGILLDWGIISILIVDGAATGSWQKFKQTSYVIDAKCDKS
jgi:predicted small secreted protein